MCSSYSPQSVRLLDESIISGSIEVPLGTVAFQAFSDALKGKMAEIAAKLPHLIELSKCCHQ